MRDVRDQRGRRVRREPARVISSIHRTMASRSGSTRRASSASVRGSPKRPVVTSWRKRARTRHDVTTSMGKGSAARAERGSAAAARWAPQEPRSEIKRTGIVATGRRQLARPVLQPGPQAAGQSRVEPGSPPRAVAQEGEDLVACGRRTGCGPRRPLRGPRPGRRPWCEGLLSGRDENHGRVCPRGVTRTLAPAPLAWLVPWIPCAHCWLQTRSPSASSSGYSSWRCSS